MTQPDIRAREVDANAAKQRLMNTLHTLQHRLSPKTIAADVTESVKDKATGVANKGVAVANQGVAKARARPFSAAAIAAPLLIFVFRKPIARALSALVGRDDDPVDTEQTPYEAAHAGPPTSSAATGATRVELVDQGA